MALIDKIKAIADAIRNKTGTEDKMTLDEMAEAIEYLESDGALATTYILVDEDGYEIPAVLTEEEVELTATANDIRKGSVAVTDAGVITGEKEIPPYYAYEGQRVVSSGSAFIIPHTAYDYTKLQAIICAYNTTLSNSVAAKKVAILDNVYDVDSVDAVSSISKVSDGKLIDFGISNDTGGNCIIRYIMYKEMY